MLFNNPVAALRAVGGLSMPDAELVRRYQFENDQEAFAELVRRHGSMILSVCTAGLGRGPDAEDAFQAVFLVLARRIREGLRIATIGAWLHGTAVLTARSVRNRRSRRADRETTMAEMPEVADGGHQHDPDLVPVVHEELNRLPDRLREAVILCELREMSVNRAAEELGVPQGTVASRLARGRTILARRLLKRGLAPAAVTAAIPAAASCRVDPGLEYRTITGIRSAEQADRAGLSAAVLTTASEVIHMTTVATIRKWAIGLAGACVIGLAGVTQFSEPSTAAPVAKGKVDGETAALNRFPLDDLQWLLKSTAVRDQLKLSDEQSKAMTKLQEETDMAMKAAIKQEMQAAMNRAVQAVPLPGAPGPAQVVVEGAVPDFAKVQDKCGSEFDAQAAKILLPEQQRRLRQIIVQSAGPEILLDRRVIRHLEMTEDQEDKIAKILPKRGGQMAMQMGLRPDKLEAELEKQWKAVSAVLTPDQTTRWNGLIGPRMKSAELAAIYPNAGSQCQNFDLGDELEFAPVIPGVALPAPPAPVAPAAPPAPPEKK